MNHLKKSMWTKVLSFSFLYLVFASFTQAASSLSDSEYPNKPTLLKADYVVNQVQIEWSKNNQEGFKHYYVLKSQVDPMPSYPEMEPVYSSSDRNETSYTETLELDGEIDYYYRVCAINTKNKVSCSNVVHVFPFGVTSVYSFYNDVEKDSWYEKYVRALLRKSIIYAGDDLKFNPSTPITRAELARWVVRAVIETGNYRFTTQSGPFCDINYSNPDALYINNASRLGIIEGEKSVTSGVCNGRTVFNPNRPVTRAEATKMILLAFDYSGDSSVVKDDSFKYENKNLFTDVHQSHWAAPFIGRAKDEGIISGYPDDSFRPDATINHAEMAKIVSEAFKYDL